MREISEQLEIFIEVVQSGGFSPAARRRNLSHSSVARRIDALERELGTRLLNRTTHAVTLTESGHSFYERARNVLNELHLAKTEIQAIETEPEGLLRVDCWMTFGQHHLVPALAEFMRRHPRVQVELTLTNSFQDVRGERVGQKVDVAIRLAAIEETRLIATPIAPMVRIACASPDYLARRGVPATPADLVHHDCLSWGELGPADAWHFVTDAGEARIDIRSNLRSNSTEALLRAALHGMGVVHLPTWLVGRFISAGRLVPLFVDAGLPAPDAATVHALRFGTSSQRTRLFIQFLKEYFAPHYWEALMPAALFAPGKSPANF